MKRVDFYIQQLFYYVLLFFILREWLIAIDELTSTSYLNFFLIFVGICFLLNIIKPPMIINWVVKLVFIGWFITAVYGDSSLFSFEGITFLLTDAIYNLNALVKFDFYNVTNPLRTFLFFVLIWMLAFLIQYWINVRHSVFYFLALTIFFVATIDTFTEYDGSRAIVVTLMLGLILTAVLYMRRLMQHANTSLAFASIVRYITPVVFIISAIGAIAYFLPKTGPTWPDPVPYIKSLAGGGEEGSQKAGLDDDDSQLGGAFAGDDTVVYEIIADSPKYWRVEAKFEYDSKGWVTPRSQLQPFEPELYFNVSPNMNADNNESITIDAKSDNTFILRTYGTHGLEYDNPDVHLVIDYGTERITSYVDGEKVPLEQYNLGVMEPVYSYTTLKKPMDEVMLMPEGDYSELLQVPNTLPQRVIDLAYEITNNYDSVYDKAKAIERYFKSNGYRYESKNVAIPEEGQDYVDQFLFETKVGYCDNFSTSMVMMLRAVGIPAIWVKGYAEGTEIGETEDGQNIYEITNNDAHSWVEAFVPEIGWMPFEPTIGFAQDYEIDFDMELTSDTPEVDDAKLEQQELKKEREQAKRIKEEEGIGGKSNEKSYWGYVLAVLAIISAVVLLSFTRSKWQTLLPNAKPTTVRGAYRQLEKRLAKRGLIRKKGETLRQFAQRVDESLEIAEMSKFIAIYERQLYSAKNEVDFLEIQESYEYLINCLEG
jgi:transglutaminase-like putative cysteine protease